MKTRLTRPYGSRYELIVDNGKNGERLVLAGMTLFEGHGAWMLTDIRLHPHRQPSKYSGGLHASDIDASFRPRSPEAAVLVRSMLREYQEDADGLIRWCTFRGLVKGTPREAAILSPNNDIGYFTRAEGTAKLKEIQAWWAAYEGPLEAAKIPNPLMQPSDTEVFTKVYLLELKAAEAGAGATALPVVWPEEPA